MSTGPFFITGATGAQGGHTARQLLSAGYAVHAIARDPNSPTALEIAKSGGKVFAADFDNISGMQAAAQGCTAAFVNASPVMTDPNGERNHVSNILTACRNAGVRQVLYTSTVGTGEVIARKNVAPPGSFIESYFESKAACEKAVRESGIESWAVLRLPRLSNTYISPGTKFMYPELATNGIIRTALRPDLRQTVVDPVDVGSVSKEILTGGYNATGKVINLVSNERLTMAEIIGAMNLALGKEVVNLHYYSEDDFAALKDSTPLVLSDDYQNKAVEPEHTLQISDVLSRSSSSIAAFFAREIDFLKEAVEG